MNDIDFLLKALKLKDEKRAGMELYSVEKPHTVAGHSWGVALLVLKYAENMDTDRAVKMAVIHDLAEAETGDRLYRADRENMEYSPDEKEDAEKDFWENADLPEELFRLWKEYEERGSKEARFVKDMDLIDMCLTALQYQKEERYDPADNQELPYDNLDEFFESARSRFHTRKGKQLFQEIEKRYENAKQE